MSVRGSGCLPLTLMHHGHHGLGSTVNALASRSPGSGIGECRRGMQMGVAWCELTDPLATCHLQPSAEWNRRGARVQPYFP